MLVIAALNLGIIAMVGALLHLVPHPRLGSPSAAFGVRTPPDRADDPVILEQRRRYGSVLLIVIPVISLLTALAGALLDSVAPASVGVAVLCLVAAALWARAHRAISQAKDTGRWYGHLRQGAVADTSLRTDPVRFPWLWTIPSALVVAVTALVGVVVYPNLPDTLQLPRRGVGETAYLDYPTTVWTAFGLVFGQVLLTALMVGVVVSALRARPDLDAAQPRGSAVRYRKYLAGTARALLAMATLLNLMLSGLSAVVWSGNHSGWLLAAIVGIPLAASLAVAAHLVLRVGGGGKASEAEAPTGLVRRDDDRHSAAAGLLYINADDPAVLVPSRVGRGWTVNLGNPRVLAGAAATLAAAGGAAALFVLM
ncbi:DUF1648 domain-containing protein [Umezawaea tangerina]|uniref:Putative membrane protein n=1 Tax=Umezawaea tangerina TaxID=84725 RepID=A0A2T0SZQ0_9PSEU|nr:DUF5808 domain-containing protein [Umezawaea tangerina]PRY38895.1 putative membrane protein [Umezawaea tangerina]